MRVEHTQHAVAEFRKVVKNFPKSDLADDAQYELGRVLLQLGRLEEAREALLEVPLRYTNSPVADDALYAIGQSYEQQAQQFTTVTAAASVEDISDGNPATLSGNDRVNALDVLAAGDTSLEELRTLI